MNNDEDRYAPVDVEVKRDEGVTIEFGDGLVAEFNLMELRLACPCATCRSIRDKGEPGWPQPGSPKPLRITDAEFHGAWGLNITWNDGHGTGIYPFESLRMWADGGRGEDGNNSGPPRIAKDTPAEASPGPDDIPNVI